MIDNRTPNKNYPLPHPENIASQDVERIADAISMIDSDMSESKATVEATKEKAENLSDGALTIPAELVGKFDTELKDLTARKYVVVNSEGNGFKTVEGGGGDGGCKGEILIKRSDKNFDTTWIDPRAILKKTPKIQEVVADTQLSSNSSTILSNINEIEGRGDLPARGLNSKQTNKSIFADSFTGYIFTNSIEETEPIDDDIASKTNYGRVKIGEGVNVNDGVISVPVIGIADRNNFGMVKIGDGLDVVNGVVSAQEPPHATKLHYGMIKPSYDFEFDENGRLALANKSADIIYQKEFKKIVEGGVVELVPTCACYRAYITEDTLFTFKFADGFEPTDDFAFDIEIISDNVYVVRFENVEWGNLECRGTGYGKTVVHFEKKLGEDFYHGELSYLDGSKFMELLTKDTNNDIQDGYICWHNGTNISAATCNYITSDYSRYTNFNNGAGGIWQIDFVRSTVVTYFDWCQGFDNWTCNYMYIEGSIDGKTWTRLLTYQNEKPTAKYLERVGFFKHYRVLSSHAQFRYFALRGFSIDDDLYEIQRVTPQMSSNSQAGYKLTSSGVASGNLYLLTEQSTSTHADFDTRDENGDYYIQYELPEPQAVDMIDLGAVLSSYSNRMPTWFKILASNDKENWDIILERNNLLPWGQGETKQYWIYNKTSYKYYRLVSIEQPVAQFSIGRFRLYKKINGLTPSGFIPILSANKQSGYELTSSSNNNNSEQPYKAFDNNTSTMWTSAQGDSIGAWIKIKFPGAVICNWLIVRARNDGYYYLAPEEFIVEGSNDGDAFETLALIKGQTWTQGEKKDFTFYNEKSYEYYRITAQKIQNNGAWFGASEINLGNTDRILRRDLVNYTNLMPIMYSDEQDGFIVTSSQCWTGGSRTYHSYDAFNGNTADNGYWVSNTNSGWIQVELPEAKIVNCLQIMGGTAGEEPEIFTFSASNDGINFIELLNIESSTWSSRENKQWDIKNKMPYKFYKIEGKTLRAVRCSIAQIKLLDKKTIKEY